MKNWKIVGNIAAGIGIISVVFSVFAAVLTYNNISMSYPPGYFSMEIILLNILTTMLNPYLFYAAISFVAAWFAMHADNEKPMLIVEEEVEPAEEKTQMEQTTS
jgi:hypothetical protein